MKSWLALVVVVIALAGARLARSAAVAERGELEIIDEPYTPSQEAAPFLSLGYRELMADLLYVRLRGYYGGYYDTTSAGVAALGEAIVALDPKFEKAYDFAANAMTITPRGVDQASFRRAVALLERGVVEFPRNWQIPLLAGQMYIQDLKSNDPAQQRAWEERGVLLVESAIRKPGAPVHLSAEWAAHVRTRLGQRERAVQGLRELMLITNDSTVRARLLARLAKLENSDSAEIAAELFSAKQQFERTWKAERPSVRRTMYLLVGKPLGRTFDLAELALGGRDFLETASAFERLEPLVPEEPAPTTP